MLSFTPHTYTGKTVTLNVDWRKENITGLEETCTVGIRPFTHYRDLSVFYIGSVLQGTHSTTLKKRTVQAFSRAFLTHVPDVLFTRHNNTVG